MTVNILGTEYEIIEAAAAEDAMLEKCDGYCDKTVKTIVISKKAKDCDLKDFSVYQKKVMRHEIIHAFLFESGLSENFTHPEYGHDETYVERRLAACENQYPAGQREKADPRRIPH